MTQGILITFLLLGSIALTACSDPESTTSPVSGDAALPGTEPAEHADEVMDGDTGHATGIITSLDRDGDRVTIDHGPIEGIGMGAMTMGFDLMGDADLTGFSEGEEVAFRVKRSRDGSYRVRDICSIATENANCLENMMDK